jgi:hypothetical protein
MSDLISKFNKFQIDKMAQADFGLMLKVCNCKGEDAKNPHNCDGHPSIPFMECDVMHGEYAHKCKGHKELVKPLTVQKYKLLQKRLIELGNQGIIVDLRPVERVIETYSKGLNSSPVESPLITEKRAKEFGAQIGDKSKERPTFKKAKVQEKSYASSLNVEGEQVKPRPAKIAKKTSSSADGVNDGASTSSGTSSISAADLDLRVEQAVVRVLERQEEIRRQAKQKKRDRNRAKRERQAMALSKDEIARERAECDAMGQVYLSDDAKDCKDLFGSGVSLSDSSSSDED